MEFQPLYKVEVVQVGGLTAVRDGWVMPDP